MTKNCKRKIERERENLNIDCNNLFSNLKIRHNTTVAYRITCLLSICTALNNQNDNHLIISMKRLYV